MGRLVSAKEFCDALPRIGEPMHRLGSNIVCEANGTDIGAYSYVVHLFTRCREYDALYSIEPELLCVEFDLSTAVSVGGAPAVTCFKCLTTE